MKKIDFSLIFNIADDGIYYDGGKLSFSDLKMGEDGFYGEELYENGEIKIVFYSTLDEIVFPFSRFDSLKTDALKNAKAKSGSCALFLLQRGIKIKTLS
ncbi:MAG: hypothetical protein IJW64_00260 [Clostridia bacterium]|nr:hypothetical protein [Clostridia bacterium]